MQLSTEIRNKIYKDLVGPEHVRFNGSGAPSKTCGTFPAILQVNKEVHMEAQLVLYKGTMFEFDSLEALKKFLDVIGLDNIKYLGNIRLRGKVPLVNGWRTRCEWAPPLASTLLRRLRAAQNIRHIWINLHALPIPRLGNETSFSHKIALVVAYWAYSVYKQNVGNSLQQLKWALERLHIEADGGRILTSPNTPGYVRGGRALTTEERQRVCDSIAVRLRQYIVKQEAGNTQLADDLAKISSDAFTPSRYIEPQLFNPAELVVLAQQYLVSSATPASPRRVAGRAAPRRPTGINHPPNQSQPVRQPFSDAASIRHRRTHSLRATYAALQLQHTAHAAPMPPQPAANAVLNQWQPTNNAAPVYQPPVVRTAPHLQQQNSFMFPPMVPQSPIGQISFAQAMPPQAMLPLQPDAMRGPSLGMAMVDGPTIVDDAVIFPGQGAQCQLPQGHHHHMVAPNPLMHLQAGTQRAIIGNQLDSTTQTTTIAPTPAWEFWYSNLYPVRPSFVLAQFLKLSYFSFITNRIEVLWYDYPVFGQGSYGEHFNNNCQVVPVAGHVCGHAGCKKWNILSTLQEIGEITGLLRERSS